MKSTWSTSDPPRARSTSSARTLSTRTAESCICGVRTSGPLRKCMSALVHLFPRHRARVLQVEEPEAKVRLVESRGQNRSAQQLTLRPNDPKGKIHEHADVSYTGRPFPLSEAAEHWKRLRSWGLTFGACFALGRRGKLSDSPDHCDVGCDRACWTVSLVQRKQVAS